MRNINPRHLAFLAIGVGAVGVLLGAVAVLPHLATPQWGDVPTWLGVIFAAFAGIAAIILLQKEAKRDELAELDRAERQADIRQAQAAMVCAWYGVGSEAVDFGSLAQEGLPKFRNVRYGGFIRNASQLPVYNVTINYFYRPETGESEKRGEITNDLIAPTDRPILVPLPDGDMRKPSGQDQDGNPVSTEDYTRFAVTMEFTDAAGRRWLRDLDGRLQATRLPISGDKGNASSSSNPSRIGNA